MSKEKLTFDDAIQLAKDCENAACGYRDDDLEIYRFGMRQIIYVLECAKHAAGRSEFLPDF